MSTSTTIKEVMRELAALEDPKMREANERRGDDHGVNLTHLRALAKRLQATPPRAFSRPSFAGRRPFLRPSSTR
jgi:3-methyladenine DNA glycosylase AlkD